MRQMIILFPIKYVRSLIERDEAGFGIIFVENIQVVNDLHTKINQDIKFVEMETWKVYEKYEINKINIIRQLGFFNSKFQYILLSNDSLVNRRNDFQGYNLKAMTEITVPYISIDLATASYDENSQTYDVTKSLTGLYHEIFLDMQKLFNFTATLHKRKDGQWGPTTVLKNGTISTGGIVNSLTSGFAEMIVAQ